MILPLAFICEIKPTKTYRDLQLFWHIDLYDIWRLVFVEYHSYTWPGGGYPEGKITKTHAVPEENIDIKTKCHSDSEVCFWLRYREK